VLRVAALKTRGLAFEPMAAWAFMDRVLATMSVAAVPGDNGPAGIDRDISAGGVDGTITGGTRRLKLPPFRKPDMGTPTAGDDSAALTMMLPVIDVAQWPAGRALHAAQLRHASIPAWVAVIHSTEVNGNRIAPRWREESREWPAVLRR